MKFIMMENQSNMTETDMCIVVYKVNILENNHIMGMSAKIVELTPFGRNPI